MPREGKTREQQLVDLVFACAIHGATYMSGWKDEDVARWAAKQLEGCGFPTHQQGLSWGVLDDTRPPL